MASSCLTDVPSANMRIDDVCTTSITLSLAVYGHSACNFSLHVNLTLSDTAISPVSINDSTYQFDGLAANTRYNFTVSLIYSTSNFIVFNGSVDTLTSKCKFLIANGVYFCIS